jgi:hypothetical protein
MRVTVGRWGKVPIAFLNDPKTTLNMVKVYATLSAFQGMSDYCFPSRAKIAELSGLSERVVSSCVTALNAAGWIVRKQRGLKKTNIYMVVDEAEIVGSVENPDVQKTITSESLDVQKTITSGCAENHHILPYIENPIYKTTLNTASDEPDAKKEPLFTTILKTFEGVSGPTVNYPREGAAIKKLIKLCTDINPEEVSKTCEVMIREFKGLREDDPFFRKQPFLASILVSGGIFPRVKLRLTNEVFERETEKRIIEEIMNRPKTEKVKRIIEENGKYVEREVEIERQGIRRSY